MKKIYFLITLSILFLGIYLSFMFQILLPLHPETSSNELVNGC